MRLTAHDLAASRGGRPVFSGLSFSVGEGEVLAVIGPNGAGKSTLLRLIAGLLRPNAGSLALDPPNQDPWRRVHYLGHLDALKPSLSLSDNLAYWRRLFGGDGLANIDEALDAMGLAGLDSLPVSVLSAGQKRRAAIARLLLCHRPVWLLDEPLTALDAHAEVLLARQVEAHRGRGGMVIAATHRDLPVDPTATVMLGGAR